MEHEIASRQNTRVTVDREPRNEGTNLMSTKRAAKRKRSSRAPGKNDATDHGCAASEGCRTALPREATREEEKRWPSLAEKLSGSRMDSSGNPARSLIRGTDDGADLLAGSAFESDIEAGTCRLRGVSLAAFRSHHVISDFQLSHALNLLICEATVTEKGS